MGDNSNQNANNEGTSQRPIHYGRSPNGPTINAYNFYANSSNESANSQSNTNREYYNQSSNERQNPNPPEENHHNNEGSTNGQADNGLNPDDENLDHLTNSNPSMPLETAPNHDIKSKEDSQPKTIDLKKPSIKSDLNFKNDDDTGTELSDTEDFYNDFFNDGNSADDESLNEPIKPSINQQTPDEISAEIMRENLRDYICSKEVHEALPEFEEEFKKRHTNNHHIVPLGVLSVLCCLYLATVLISESFTIGQGLTENGTEPDTSSSFLNETLECKRIDNEEDRKAFILEKLLEHKDFCYDLEIFTEDLTDMKPTFIDPEPYDGANSAKKENEIPLVQFLMDGEVIEVEISTPKDSDSSSKSPRGSIAKFIRRSAKNAKNFKNGLKGKNGNKGIKAKNGMMNNDKKPENNNNNCTVQAEPIIYCFAFVLICLLGRSLSDFFEEYKKKKQNENAVRRCSLQSYAQTHKPDRRASKEQKQLQRQFSSTRSFSVDRFRTQINKDQLNQRSDLLKELRKYASFEEKQNIDKSLDSIHIQTQLLEIGEKQTEPSGASSRRCSLNYTRPKFNSLTSNDPMSRRTSIASGIGVTMGVSINSLGFGFDTNETETKRRVRMINRH